MTGKRIQPVQCQGCGIMFKPRIRMYSKFHSRECYESWMKKNPNAFKKTKKLHELVCPICSKPFTRPQWRVDLLLRAGRKPTYCSRDCLIESNRRRWKNQEWVDKYQTSMKATPNRTEVSLLDFLPSTVRFTGDGTFYLKFKNGRYKNPDYKVTGKKQVIELFGGIGWFHSEQEATELVELYREIGYACLVVYSDEVKHRSRHTDLKVKITQFLNQS